MRTNRTLVSLWAVVLLTAKVVSCIGAKTPTGDQKAEYLRKKYSAAGFVHDVEHIKDDLKHLIQFSSDGTFTLEESIFYLVRMHDFDDNNQLDGLELMRAFGHAHVHQDAKQQQQQPQPQQQQQQDAKPQDAADDTPPPIETIEQLVDETMQFDTNFDGMLSYAEWLKGYNK